MKNKVGATFLLTLLVVCGLTASYFLPPITVGEWSLRKVDLLSDVRVRPKEVIADSDTIAPPKIEKPAFVDSCKSGMTCIEDFADSTAYGMQHFYDALTRVNEMNRPVRIAYFGDSFIEGDILTGYLREFLQKKYGGRGVGYVSITNPTAGFRPTVIHRYSGWSSHASTDSCCFVRANQDLANRYFIPRSGAWVSLRGTNRNYSTVDTCTVSTCYFLSNDSVHLQATLNDRDAIPFAVVGDSTLQALTVEGRIGSVKWSVREARGKSLFYGVSMESKRGVVVDNFSLRGSSGQQLRSVPERFLNQFHHLRPYDLIVLHYGPNIASQKVRNYSYYTRAMSQVMDHLKRCFPNTSFLIIGASDRAVKDEFGELVSMQGTLSLIQYQKSLAADQHIAFWNLYEAMGGEGSIVRMVQAKPSEANYDYTHINFRGGKHLAQILFDALVYGQEQYVKRKQYEAK